MYSTKSRKVTICLADKNKKYSQQERITMSFAGKNQPDPLMLQLAQCEGQLAIWLQKSAANALHFAQDPVGAMKAAHLSIDEEVFAELEQLTRSLGRKINSVM